MTSAETAVMPLTAKPTESVFVRKSGYSLSNCITPFLYIGTGSPAISGDAYFINSFVTPKPSAAIMLSGTFFSRFAARFTSSGTISILYGSSEIRLKHGITQVRPSRTANSTPRRPASKASFTSQSDAPAAQQRWSVLSSMVRVLSPSSAAIIASTVLPTPPRTAWANLSSLPNAFSLFSAT